MSLLKCSAKKASLKGCRQRERYSVVSLHLNNADISLYQLQYLGLDYRRYPTDYCGMIWSTPPWTEYSTAKQKGISKIAEANAIVSLKKGDDRIHQPLYLVH